MDQEIHPTQAKILRCLLFKEHSRFAELNIDKLATDRFTFHLNQLIGRGLVEKGADKLYSLSTKGKEYSNRMDTDKVIFERPPKIAICASCTIREGQNTKYLVQQRLKQPYFGYYGIVSGKVRWGESLKETASRELLEETGLTVGSLTLLGVERKMDYSVEGDLLEDKCFFVFLGTRPSGNFVSSFEGGCNYWFTKEEILKLPNLFDDVPQLINIFGDYRKNPRLTYFENKFTVTNY